MKYKTLSLIFIVPLTFFVIIPYILFNIEEKLDFYTIPTSFFNTIGALFTIAGALLFLYCTNIFRQIGKGTPVPTSPPKRLVEKKVYRRTRNPMYISYFLILLGLSLYYGSILLFIYTIMYIVFIQLYVVYFEEPSLFKRFGKTYVRYTKQVPRWI